jgi:hypothetical protein
MDIDQYMHWINVTDGGEIMTEICCAKKYCNVNTVLIELASNRMLQQGTLS